VTTDREVLFIEDICIVLGMGRRSVERKLHYGAFPIPTIPSLDKRHRWSRSAVDAFLAQQRHGTKSTRLSRRRHLKQVDTRSL
jgi:predicted DNA-binding transcriptional regulator AlpA